MPIDEQHVYETLNTIRRRLEAIEKKLPDPHRPAQTMKQFHEELAEPPVGDAFPADGERRDKQPAQTVDHAIEAYTADLYIIASREHTENTKRILLSFHEWACKTYVVNISKPTVRHYRDQMIADGKAPKTINNHLAALSSFYSFCHGAGWVEENPAKGLKVPNGNGRDQRKAFAVHQIQMVFGYDCEHVLAEAPSIAAQWLPIIMLHTGARPEEVAQLRIGDIRKVGGLRELAAPGNPADFWVFDFGATGHGQRHKNEASKRLVPVASVLWERGLGDLRAHAQHATEGSMRLPENVASAPLFPELHTVGASGRLSESPARWFNRTYLRKRCAIQDPKLVLYSLRHSVATRLKHNGAEDSLVSQILGHSEGGTTSRYAKEYPLEAMQQALDGLDWRV